MTTVRFYLKWIQWLIYSDHHKLQNHGRTKLSFTILHLVSLLQIVNYIFCIISVFTFNLASFHRLLYHHILVEGKKKKTQDLWLYACFGSKTWWFMLVSLRSVVEVIDFSLAIGLRLLDQELCVWPRVLHSSHHSPIQFLPQQLRLPTLWSSCRYSQKPPNSISWTESWYVSAF